MPLRQLALRLLQPLVDEIAREIDVRAVLEHDGHLRQAVARQRARVFDVGQARDGRFHRVRDALLDFQRRVAFRLGVDLHLDVGDVGHCVDRQALIVPTPDTATATTPGTARPSDGRSRIE